METGFLYRSYWVLEKNAARSKSSSANAATVYYSEATLVSFIYKSRQSKILGLTY